MAKKKLPLTVDEINERRDVIFNLLDAESDRGLVLVSASFLDEALEVLLRARFGSDKHKLKAAINPLFNAVGPLATYSAKIRLSYALNLINEWTYHDLEIIREIRNDFAHEIASASFDDPNVFRLTERLRGADYAVAGLTREGKKRNKGDVSQEKDGTSSQSKQNSTTFSEKQLKERMRFAMTISFIGGLLYAKVGILQNDGPQS